MVKPVGFGEGDASANQKGRMSDDPGDGARTSFAPEQEAEGAGPEAGRFAAEGQGPERLAELGRRGSRQA